MREFLESRPDSSDRLDPSQEAREELEFLLALQDYLGASDRAAEQAGLSPPVYELLLEVRCGIESERLTPRQVAESMMMERPSSIVDLVTEAETSGLLYWDRDPSDPQGGWLGLTTAGEAKLELLARLERRQLPGVEAVTPPPLGL